MGIVAFVDSWIRNSFNTIKEMNLHLEIYIGLHNTKKSPSCKTYYTNYIKVNFVGL